MSKIKTFLPNLDKRTAKFANNVERPMPRQPAAKVITCTELLPIKRRNPAAWSV